MSELADITNCSTTQQIRIPLGDIREEQMESECLLQGVKQLNEQLFWQ